MRHRLTLLLILSLLALAAGAAPISAAGQPAPNRAGSAPVRLRIPAIGLNQPLVSVGLDAKRRPIVPRHNAGWYNLSARPGEGSNVVMWGHVLRWKNAPRIPAPFARLKELKIGAVASVVTDDGHVYRYRVARKVWARPNEVERILPTASEQLTLVSCIGDNMIVGGELTKQFRLITIATPVK